MKFPMLKSALALSIAVASGTALAGAGHSGHHPHAHEHSADRYFNRVATFPVYQNLDLVNGDALEDETAAEISAASNDGNVVYYSDSPMERVGLINITNVSAPTAG